MFDIKAKEFHVSIIKPLSKGNKKYLIQQGIFMFTNVPDIKSYIHSNEKGTKYLFEFDFPVSEKEAVMRELKLMGISGTSLFPTLEGICKGGKEEFLNN